MKDAIEIREATDSDFESILRVVTAAFGREDEAALVRELLEDPSAEPRLSLIAVIDGETVGHILFTAAHLLGTREAPATCILAPLAVLPSVQRGGIGTRLAEQGLEMLKKSGAELVFVLGHPSYYPRFGFEPAGQRGFEAPYPIPRKYSDAWMVKALRAGIVGKVGGTVACADALNKEEDWRE